MTASRTAEDERPHRVHRLAHAVYGLILLTATVGELRLGDESPASAITIVAAGGAVLVVAHTYSQVLATAAASSAAPGRREVGAGLVDQLVLAVPAVSAICVLALAQADVLPLATAYNLILVASLVVLFLLGLLIGSHHRRSLAWRLVVASANLALGAAIVLVEIGASH